MKVTNYIKSKYNTQLGPQISKWMIEKADKSRFRMFKKRRPAVFS